METVAIGIGTNIVVTNLFGHWAFDHTGSLTNVGAGQSLTNLAGSEVEGCFLLHPCTNDLGLADCPHWGTNQYDTVKLADTVLFMSQNEICPSNADPHAYMTIYRAASGPSDPALHAQVFAVGSMQWSWGLDEYGYSTSWLGFTATNNTARQITHNVLQTFSGKARTPIP
jgi:hypothetical protein